jgi:hypothetical protein
MMSRANEPMMSFRHGQTPAIIRTLTEVADRHATDQEAAVYGYDALVLTDIDQPPPRASRFNDWIPGYVLVPHVLNWPQTPNGPPAELVLRCVPTALAVKTPYRPSE